MALVWLSSVLLTGPVLLAQQKEKQPTDKAQRTDKAEERAPSEVNGAVPSQRSEEINIAVGENYTLSAAGVRSYSSGAHGVADVRLTPDNGQFVIIGQKPGSTTLLLIKKDNTQTYFTVNVFQRAVETVERELAQLLEGTPGVRIRRVGSRFFIEGGVSTEPELKRLEHIAALFPGQVDSLVVLGGAAAERKVNVRVDFIFVQFDRNKTYQFGLGYPGRIGGPNYAKLSAGYNFLGGGFSSATASVVNQPLPGLDLAATNGWAKVLKHSAVITSNGTEAKFSSGGEQNYVITSGMTASLTQIAFGTNVTVLPRFDPATRELEVRVEAEVADLTPTVAAGTDLPGRSTSKLSTLVSLKLGQSIVLSGIRTRSERHAISGIPVLSEIPVLGVLFGSHGNANQEIEGAILVIPSVVESVPKTTKDVLDDALAQYKAYSGDLQLVNTWDKTAVPPAPRSPLGTVPTGAASVGTVSAGTGPADAVPAASAPAITIHGAQPASAATTRQ